MQNETTDNVNPLVFFVPAAILSNGIALWILGPKFVINVALLGEKFSYPALLSCFSAWIFFFLFLFFIPFSYAYGMMKKANTGERNRFTIGVSIIAYILLIMVFIDLYYYDQWMVNCVLWDTLPNNVVRWMPQTSPLPPVEIIFVIVSILSIAMIFLYNRIPVLKNTRSALAFILIHACLYAIIVSFSFAEIYTFWKQILYITALGKIVIICLSLLTGYFVFFELILWQSLKDDDSAVRHMPDEDISLEGFRLPKGKVKDTWNIVLHPLEIEFMKKNNGEKFIIKIDDLKDNIKLLFPWKPFYINAVKFNLDDNEYIFALSGGHKDIHKVMKWLGSRREKIIAMMGVKKTIYITATIYIIVLISWSPIVTLFCVAAWAYHLVRLNKFLK